MSKSKQKGTSFENQVVAFFRRVLCDSRIERRTLAGKNDRGDITGIFLRGFRVVIECKNCVKLKLAEWIEEAEIERLNDDAEFAFVVFKRKGCGEKNIGKSYVLCTLENLAALIAGSRKVLYSLEEADDDELLAEAQRRGLKL